MGRLDNKVCIITGASSGIGLAAARRFAEEGAILSLFARRADRLEALRAELEEKHGTRVLVIPGDVTRYEDIVCCVDTTARMFGRIDVLINNAGIVDDHIPITRCSNEFWDKIIAVDMTSVFQFSREVLRYMEPAGKGSIVNVSSEAGYYGNCGFPYSAGGNRHDQKHRHPVQRDCHPLQLYLPGHHPHRAQQPGGYEAFPHRLRPALLQVQKRGLPALRSGGSGQCPALLCVRRVQKHHRPGSGDRPR